MERCATCGYPHDMHEHEKCPVCACGDAPAQHEVTAGERRCACGCASPPVPSAMHIPEDQRCALCVKGMPHACIWARWLGHPCPGRRSTGEASRGKWLVLRQGNYKPPVPEAPRREWFGLSVPIVEPKTKEIVAPEPAGPPRVAARPPLSPGEFAGYGGRQAVGLGRKAIGRGWDLSPWYWMAADGSEGCAIRLARGRLRAVVTWKRASGRAGEKSGWSADVAYGWTTDGTGFPVQITHTQLEGFI